MGAAMAPAAADTLQHYFEDTGTSPDDYDLIVTGDLGMVGHDILVDLMGRNGYSLGANYTDCGLLLYDRKRQDVHAGGSGCGCSAGVLCGHLLPQMQKGNLKKILFGATGALMSTTSSQQGESIPGICHLLEIVRGE
jgi:stage V sporulation protein AD